MKKNAILSSIFAMLLCLIGYGNLNAHGGFNKHLSLKQQIEKSALVVEGKVIAQTSVWDDEYRYIYTVNTVEVYKVFKGNSVGTIEVITKGGTVGLTALIAHPSLRLHMEDIGVFTLTPNAVRMSRAGNSNFKKYEPYGLSQGFYRYNLRENLAANPVRMKLGIADAFYNEIKLYAKTRMVQLKSYDVKSVMAKASTSKNALPPGPITLGSSAVTAGTKELLTITGTNFGMTQGKVWFRNADDGGATFISALDSEVDTWNNTTIVVEVPSGAGTGTIFVEDSSAGQSPLSSITLTVTYSEINVQSTAGGNPVTAYPIRHVDANDSGGYTWEMQTNFFNETEPGVNTGYKAAFTRALNKWICETGINWSVSGSATGVNSAGVGADNTDLISFDQVGDLDSGSLGACFTWASGCAPGGPGPHPPSSIFWFVEENDIIFDDETDWYTGTGAPGGLQYDFESVALHELGHAHQLAHVIDPIEDGNNLDDVMHWDLTNGESQKVLNANNITGANAIQSRSNTAPSVCSETVMTDASCPLSVEEEQLSFGVRVYPNPAKESFFLTNESIIPITSIEIYDVSGRVISVQNFTDDSKVKTVNMANASGGLYIIKILGDNASVTKKLVLE